MFTGQAREFPSLGGQLWARRRQQRALSSLSGYFCKSSLAALRLATCTHRLIQDESEGGSSNYSSCSGTCLTLHHPPSLPSPGPLFSCHRLHHRCHHVRLFPPGLPQLARRLLRDRWASLYLLSLPPLFDFVCAVFPWAIHWFSSRVQ